jgi:ATP adenylyltransferase
MPPTPTSLDIWQKTIDRTQLALASGALQSIPTHYEWVEENGIQFLVRVVDNIRRKVEARQAQKKKGPDFNPFLPYEEDLFVCDLSPTHVALLNKFNVVDHHLLIITRHFESQESLLTLQNFEALWAVLQEIDGLAFYNGGRLAGASQPHKHLQVVPLPFVPNDPMPHARLPIEPVIQSALPKTGVATVPILPFQHAIAPLHLQPTTDPTDAVKQLQKTYHALLQTCGLAVGDGVTPAAASGAYNLLATRDWMFLIPRIEESCGKIGVNSLGFAGALLVKNEKQLAKLKQRQPLEILAQVAKPALPTEPPS